ncbi:MAG: hypothetical protein CMM18_05450 [Rhodospirillaceae bacterium]|nr:hypothetical protein [Rhodospirillaceae bacterium]|tara:strand:- start:4727 stop:5278 length:552 start_codon:yes stop_codon:yes gene_type:complete
MYLVGFLILLYQNKFIKFLLLIFFSICIPFLNGCGFQPLYGENKTQTLSILESKIDIEKIKGRNGQILRNALLEQFGSDRNTTKTITLKVVLDKSIVPLAFRSDKTVTRFNVKIHADYLLQDKISNKILTRGSSSSIASYSVVLSEFANLSASKDAEERALIDLSKNISRLVGVYLINHKSIN